MSNDERPSGPPEKGRGRGKKSVRNGSSRKPASRNARTRARTRTRGKDERIPDDAGVGAGPDFAEAMQNAAQKALIIDLVAEESLSYSGAAKRAGVDRVTLWRWRKSDPVFAENLAAAYDEGTDALKDTAVKRGKAESDFLLIRSIMGRDPSWRDPKYNVVRTEPRAPGDVTLNLDDCTPDERLALRRMAERQAKAKEVAR